MKLSEKIWSATMLLDGPNNCGIPLESMKELYTLARECECNVDIMHDRIAALEAELDEARRLMQK